MTLTHTVGNIQTILNPRKGIWCEFCHKECENDHLIKIQDLTDPANDNLICPACAIDLIQCLKLSLTDALLTDKPVASIGTYRSYK